MNNFNRSSVVSIKLFKSRIIWLMLKQRRSLINILYWGFNWMTHYVNLDVIDGQQIIQVMNNSIMGCNRQVLFLCHNRLTQCCVVNCWCFLNELVQNAIFFQWAAQLNLIIIWLTRLVLHYLFAILGFFNFIM